MRALGRAGIATWAVLTLGYLAYPGTALAQQGGFISRLGQRMNQAGYGNGYYSYGGYYPYGNGYYPYGNGYYPYGEPYPTAAPTARLPATPTPTANVIPDLEHSAAVANNIVQTRFPAVRSSIREELAQELVRSLKERIDRLESSLRAALFSEADKTAFLAIYKRSFTEDTPQFRLARKNIKDLDADELRQGLDIDGIIDHEARVYVVKLEVSARFRTFREVLGGQSSAEFDQAAKGLLKTYERIARLPKFNDLSVPDPDQVRAEVSRLLPFLEVRQRLARARETAAGSMVTMDKRFRIVSYPGLPKDTVQAIDPQVCLCLWGTGTGTIEVRDAELLDLGVPLLNREASPLAETPRPPAPSGAIIYNPKSSPGTVHYYVTDGVSYELKPGESRTHEVNANSKITYDRGGTLGGNITYQLTAGTYKFSIQDRAWQVMKPTFSVIIDNSANAFDFQCNVDGQLRVVPARKTLQLASIYPISIRFDRGEGQATSCKLIGVDLIGETPQVTVGVAPGSTALDLFPGSSQELCIRPMASESITSLTQPGSATPARVGRHEDLR